MGVLKIMAVGHYPWQGGNECHDPNQANNNP